MDDCTSEIVCSTYSGGGGSGSAGDGEWIGGTSSGGGSGGSSYYWYDPCAGSRISTELPPYYGEDCNEEPGWVAVATPYPALVNSLKKKLSLNSQQADWLVQNIDIANMLEDALQESLNRDPIDDNTFSAIPSVEAIAASKMTIDAAMNNLIFGPYDANHWNLIKVNIPGYEASPIIDPIWWANFTMQVALLRLDHPDWSSIKLYWEASQEMIHTGLDVIGMVPVVGEVADLTNGIIYTLQGDGLNATLSFAATVPIAGWAATAVKYAKKTITALDGTKRTLNFLKRADGLIDFGNRDLLRKVLGLAKGENKFAHHIIPWEHFNKGIVQKAAGADFHLNEILNGIPLTSVQHSGSHALYNTKVGEKLQSLLNQSNAFNWTNDQCANAVRNLANDIRNWIVSHPNESINNIIIP